VKVEDIKEIMAYGVMSTPHWWWTEGGNLPKAGIAGRDQACCKLYWYVFAE
jgi:hypothetical protein